MRITLVGTGISQGIPVIGCPCAACRSTDPHDKRLRTAAVISDSQTQIAIDIGPDFRWQMLSNQVESIDAVLVTHEHSDHIAGLDDIRPYNWIMGGDIPFYAEPRVLKALKQRFPYAFVSPEERYPGAPAIEQHPVTDLEREISIGSMRIQPFRVIHGQLPILGFRFGKLAYITDASQLPHESYRKLEGVEVLIINALRYFAHPSHFSLDEALQTIEQIGPRRAYLTHVSHEMGPVAKFSRTLPSNVYVGYDGLVINVEQ